MRAYVGRGHFAVAEFMRQASLSRIDVLHVDIQGYEMEMLEGCEDLLERKAIDYLFLSTHTQDLHRDVLLDLQAVGYRVEVSSDFEHQTTSFDGFVFATSPDVPQLLPGFKPPERARIPVETPADIVRGLADNLALRR